MIPSTTQTLRAPGGSGAVALEAWLNQMADQGWIVTSVRGNRFTFEPVERGESHVHVEPVNQTFRLGRGRSKRPPILLSPVSALLLSNDPNTRVVSTGGGRLIATWTGTDPLARLHPVARAAGYRTLVRDGRIAVWVYVGLLAFTVALAGWVAFIFGGFVPLPTGFLGPFIVFLTLCVLLVAAMMAGLVALLRTASAVTGAAADRLRAMDRAVLVASPRTVVNAGGLGTPECLQWLQQQAAQGWALASFDGDSGYEFEATAPGEYLVDVETAGLGFIPTYVVASEPSSWLAPGDALLAVPDAEIVGVSYRPFGVRWIAFRRPASQGPLTPPGLPSQIAGSYGAAAARLRAALGRTTGGLITMACLLVLVVALLLPAALFLASDGLDLSNPAVLTSVALTALLVFQVINLGRQRFFMRRHVDELQRCAERYDALSLSQSLGGLGSLLA